MSFLNNDFEPCPKENKYFDRSFFWNDEDEERYQQELKRQKEIYEEGLHFRDL